MFRLIRLQAWILKFSQDVRGSQQIIRMLHSLIPVAPGTVFLHRQSRLCFVF